MSNIEDSSLKNLHSLIENYESAIRDITSELDTFQVEQYNIKKEMVVLLEENKRLSSDLNLSLANKSSTEITDHLCENDDLVENLKQQIKTVCEEKEYTAKLWQNATDTVDYLEQQLKLYQDNTQGFIPKSELSKLKVKYEDRIKTLEDNLLKTQSKLEETIKSASKELDFINREIVDTYQSQDNTFKIVKNLEDEILKLQERLTQNDQIKSKLEEVISRRNREIETLKFRNNECMKKVEEAVRVVEAALLERDAAMLREAHAKEEVSKISKTLAETTSAVEDRIRNETNAVKVAYEEQFNKILAELRSAKDELKDKSIELERNLREITLLNNEIQRLQKGHLNVDESSTSKLLILEKNLEGTFQKLLLAEKHNIQLTSENESIRNDLDQMSRYYERDINARETEKIILKNEIKALEIKLIESHKMELQNSQTIADLRTKIEQLEAKFSDDLRETKSALQKSYAEKSDEVESVNKRIVEELQNQLESQMEINRKWRNETKNIAEKLEGKINELKTHLSKIKGDNKVLSEKLKDANSRIQEYKKFLQAISRDVSKITNIALPDKSEFTVIS